MHLAKLISQTHMHAIFRFVSQDPRGCMYLERLDVVDLKKIAPVPGSEKYVLDICFHRATYRGGTILQFMESSSITGRSAVILKSLLFSFMELSGEGQHQRQNLVNLS
jgi:hypothetical protein